MRHTPFYPLIVALAIGLALMGCGDSDDAAAVAQPVNPRILVFEAPDDLRSVNSVGLILDIDVPAHKSAYYHIWIDGHTETYSGPFATGPVVIWVKALPSNTGFAATIAIWDKQVTDLKAELPLDRAIATFKTLALPGQPDPTEPAPTACTTIREILSDGTLNDPEPVNGVITLSTDSILGVVLEHPEDGDVLLKANLYAGIEGDSREEQVCKDVALTKIMVEVTMDYSPDTFVAPEFEVQTGGIKVGTLTHDGGWNSGTVLFHDYTWEGIINVASGQTEDFSFVCLNCSAMHAHWNAQVAIGMYNFEYQIIGDRTVRMYSQAVSRLTVYGNPNNVGQP